MSAAAPSDYEVSTEASAQRERASEIVSPQQPVIGLQLSTVRSQLDLDFAGSLKRVAEIGYTKVETLGAFGRDPLEVRDILDSSGLVSPSQFIQPGDYYAKLGRFIDTTPTLADVLDAWGDPGRVEAIVEEAITRAKILGQTHIVWGVFWPDDLASRARIEAFAKSMDRAGKMAAAEGLMLCFHNHHFEFQPVEGVVPFDVLLDMTDPEHVKVEFDTHWARLGGADPLEYVVRYPGRIVLWHLKDSTTEGGFAIPGEGVVDFPALLRTIRATEKPHLYVEYDRPKDPWRVASEAFRYLSQLG